QLQGAWLNFAQLQGASLDGAQLQGASLNFAQLQGASLNSAQLQGASLRSVFAWRADALTSDTRNSWIDAVRPHRSEACGDRASNYTCDFTTESFQKLRAAVAAAIPEERRRDSVLRTIDERLDPSPDKQLARDEMLATWWSSRNTLRAAWADHEAEMAKHWLAAACAPEGAPHVVSALVARLLAGANPFSDDSPHPADLARDFLSDTCEGAKGLSDDDKARLRRFAATDRAKPTPPPRPPPP
ncbi:MAG: pentapeptide repeat-containing protein, partial [Acetobacteraceae bacterium]